MWLTLLSQYVTLHLLKYFTNTVIRNSRILKIFRELLVGAKQLWKKFELAFEYPAEHIESDK